MCCLGNINHLFATDPSEFRVEMRVITITLQQRVGSGERWHPVRRLPAIGLYLMERMGVGGERDTEPLHRIEIATGVEHEGHPHKVT